MSSRQFVRQSSSYVKVFITLLLGVAAGSAYTQTLTLTSDMDVAARVASAPPGTTFVFMPGVYHAQVNPKSGDKFISQGGAILNGAKTLVFAASGGYWSASVGRVDQGKARCVSGHPLCDLQADLYVDDVVLSPVPSRDQLSSNTWFYDTSTQTALVRFNPAGHKIEISRLKWAFNNTAPNVTVSHLIVEKYASPPQFGAIGAQGALSNGTAGAQGWTVTDTEVRLSHGTGIQLSDRSSIIRCNVHHNGQKGVGGRGPDFLVQDSEISFNNYAEYDHGWEAGGSKFTRTRNLRLLNNYVHDNAGAGLWGDIDNHDALIRLNRVDNNAGSGIQYEISYGAVIENNTVRWNGIPPRVSLWQAQISIQNSDNVIVRNNTVIVPKDAGNGIVVINQERETGDLGPHLGSSNTIVRNTMTYEGLGGASGLMDALGTATNNQFDQNTYVFKAGGSHFESRGKKTWGQFRDLGNDQHSRVIDSMADNR